MVCRKTTSGLTGAIGRGYSNALPTGAPHLADAPVVWQVLSDQIRDRKLVFRDALDQWTTFLAGGVISMLPGGASLVAPAAAARLRPLGNMDPVATLGASGALAAGGGQGWPPIVFQEGEKDKGGGAGNGESTQTAGEGAAKPCCCVKSFSYPATLEPLLSPLTNNAGEITAWLVGIVFSGEAEFDEKTPGCACHCCVFEQQVAFTHDFHNYTSKEYDNLVSDPQLKKDEKKLVNGETKGYGNREQEEYGGELGFLDGYGDSAGDLQKLKAAKDEMQKAADDARETAKAKLDNAKKFEQAKLPPELKEQVDKEIKEAKEKLAAADADLVPEELKKRARDLAMKRNTGCFYLMIDNPRLGIEAGVTALLKWRFVGRILDPCCPPPPAPPTEKESIELIVKARVSAPFGARPTLKMFYAIKNLKTGKPIERRFEKMHVKLWGNDLFGAIDDDPKGVRNRRAAR